MCKWILMVLLIVPLTYSFSQPHVVFAEGIARELCEETDGYIRSFEFEDDEAVLWIKLPNYYSFDSARRDINALIRSYNDIDLMMPWSNLKEFGDGVAYASYYRLPKNNYMTIVYIVESRVVGLVVEQK